MSIKITKENFKPDDNNIYTNTDDFLKFAVEDKTYQKLISIGKSNKFGFYIKFADRLHNLRTIGIFKRHKKEAKITETKKWILPLAKLLKSKYFYDHLNNECFLISTEEENQNFINYYKNYFKNIKIYLHNFKTTLKNQISTYLSNSKENLSLFNIIIRPKTQFELYNTICNRFEINKIANIKESNFVYVPTFNVYVILNENVPKQNALSLLYQIVEETELNNQIKLIGFNTDVNSFESYIRNKNNIIFLL